MKTVLKIAKHSEEIIGCTFLVLFVGLSVVNVLLRYFFGFILSWAEEGILIAFVWCVFLGTITAFRYDRHVAIDVLFNKFPEKVQKAVAFMIDILILALNFYMTYLAIVMCMHLGNKSTYVLRLSYVYVNLSMVICFGVMSILSVCKLIEHLREGYQIEDSVTRLIKEVENEIGNISEDDDGQKGAEV